MIGEKMKRNYYRIIQKPFSAFIIGLYNLCCLICMQAWSGSIGPDRCYVWGIENSQLHIEPGAIITDADLIVRNLKNSGYSETDTLYIHLLNNPGKGVTSFHNEKGDDFSNAGLILLPSYQDRTGGTKRLTYTFSELDDQSSWVWDIFSYPFRFLLADSSEAVYSSSLIELIDNAGTGQTFGFGLDPDGDSPFYFDDMILRVKIDRYSGQQNSDWKTFNLIVDDFQTDELRGWSVVDEGENEGPSDWRIENGVLLQDSNIYTTTSDPVRPGTCLLYNDGYGLTNYTLQVKGKSEDDDAVGILFRYQDADNYYIFVWNQSGNYRRLCKHVNGEFTVLQQDNIPYLRNQYYEYLINVIDTTLQIDINGQTIFSVQDSDLTAGTFGFYSWANRGSYFDDLFVLGTDINHRPDIELSPQPVQTIKEKDTLTFNVTADDFEGDAITLTAPDSPQGSQFTDGQFSWTPSYADAGEYTLTFLATDGKAVNKKSVTLTVEKGNFEPVIDIQGDFSGLEAKGVMTFTVSVTDADGDTTSVVPDGILSDHYTAQNKTFTWRPWYQDSGQYTLTFYVTDGKELITKDVQLTVTDQPITKWYEKWVTYASL
jgi:hypothetical protein